MDRYPGYQSMLTRVEHMKMQVRAQLAPEQFHLVDDLVAFVFDQVDECCNVATVDASTDTTEDYPLSNGPVTRGALADDTRIDVIGQANPQLDHQHEGSISSGQTVSPVPPPPTGTYSSIQTNIKVEVEETSNEQSVQHFKCVKKEEDGGEYVMECDCEDCETCRVKREMKEELEESGETELGGNSFQVVQGCIRVKKEEEEEGEVGRPKKIQRTDLLVRNVPVGSPSANIISINVEGRNDQMSTSSTNPTTIEDHTQPSQPVTIPLPTQIVTPIQPSSSAQPVNETLRDELLNSEPRIDNVVDMGAEEFDREQLDGDYSTLNPMRAYQDDEKEEEKGDETIEERDAPSAGAEQQVQVSTESFMKRIEPADELGNKFECDYRACAKRMKQRSDLIRHIRTHTGEKPFKCSVEGCDRAFVHGAKLKAHLNVHSGTRPFVCSWPGCEARFAQNCHLTVHTRTHTGERPFECDLCDAAFTYHSNLVIHLRIHTGSRPFICTWPDCGQAFARSDNLKTHSLVHSNERQFVCDVTGCSKVYKHKHALRRHHKDKHN